MRRLLLILPLIIVSLVIVTVTPTRAEGSTASWTFLVYLDGDNNVEQAAINDFLEMARVGSSADVNIVAQLDRVPGFDDRYGNWEETRRFYITEGMEPTSANGIDIGEANMGDPVTLYDFVTWGKATYPAQNYALIMWDHGDGWPTPPRESISPASGDQSIIAQDITNGNDVITAPEMRQAMAVISNNGADPLDVLVYNACLMAMIEVDNQLVPYVLWRVASEEDMYDSGLPYEAILADLVADPVMSPRDLSILTVDQYYAHAGRVLTTLSAVDLGTVYTALNDAADQLAVVLSNKVQTQRTQIARARVASQEFSNDDYIDLYDFAYQLTRYSGDAEIAAAAGNVMTAVDQVVVREHHAAGWTGAHGISIYFPPQYIHYHWFYDGDVAWLEFTQNTHWDEWLDAFYSVQVTDQLAPPILRVPRDHTNITAQSPSFIWTPVRGACQYWIEITDDPTFQDIIVTTPATINRLDVPDYFLFPYNVYYWRVRSGDCVDNWSVWSPVSQFTISILRSPRNASHITDTTPMLLWYASRLATQYQMQVDDDADFSSPEFEYVGPLTRATVSPALLQGQYWWRAQSRRDGVWSDYGPVWTFTVTPPPPGRPRLTTPRSGVNLDTPTPALAWEAVTGGKRYQIQVDDQGNFNSPVIDETLDPGILTFTPPVTLPDGGRYFWRVRAINEQGVSGAWSARWWFSLNQLPRPALIAPAMRAVLPDATPTFEWDAVTDADHYQIEIDDDRRFGTPDDMGDPAGTTFTSGGLADGAYYWRARAVNAAGIPGQWSALWLFTVDTTGPVAPVLRGPADRSGTPSTTPRLVWQRSRDAIQYRVQIFDDPALAIPIMDEQTPRTLITAPLDYGTYYWQVAAMDGVGNWGAWSPANVFYVTILRAPRDGSATRSTRPAFAWNAVPGAVEYEFLLDDDTDFSSPVETYSGPGQSFRPAAPLDYGTYTWRVRVDTGTGSGFGDWMPTWEVIITPATPARVRLEALSNRALTNQAGPVFVWGAVAGVESYHIQIDDTAGFSSPEQTAVVDILTYTADPLAEGRYFWRVRAINHLGAPGSWSAVWQVTVDTTPPAVPILIGPAEGASVTNRMLRLTWDRVSDAGRYDIQLDPDPAFVLPAIDAGARTSYRTPLPLSYGTYHWRARAIDSAGNMSAWSVGRNFTITAGNTFAADSPTWVESDSEWVQMTGFWSPEETIAASGGRYLRSSGRDQDDVLTLTFQGTGITVLLVKDPAYGTLGIEIDGVLVRQIVCDDVTGRTFDVQAVIDGLAAGTHTLRVYPVAGIVGVDAFLIR
ncbi:MAG: hypothetical protein JXQ72_11325 [Anaerolineae bacterium]|nr:hypothetical protein [Anaerolineae bacterium]